MSKRQQLDEMQRLGLPVPDYRVVSYEDHKNKRLQLHPLRPPFAVRSTYATEDSEATSMAGQFLTLTDVAERDIPKALGKVFNSYPKQEGSEVIVQEFIEADYSGVLFAFREGSWKIEMAEGRGEAVVGGKQATESLLLPRFSAADVKAARWISFWAPLPGASSRLKRALIRLSALTGQLLRELPGKHGLDIEFSIAGDQLWLLQARPITTPEEAEEVLTSANHKEILPPRPSWLMTRIISQAGYDLFQYYRDLDPSLPPRAFLREASGMPWINLSALLDTMVHWGLPTQLVCRSVGAEDFYKVGLRPWRVLSKLPVFLKVLGQQLGAKRKIERWQKSIRQQLEQRRTERAEQWATAPGKAFGQWLEDFERLYVELVTQMQILTGAMSGPVGLLDKLGLLPRLSAALQQKSASTDYLQAFRRWQAGELSRQDFLERFGHRGFYESDIGQRRFREYTDEEWARLQGDQTTPSAVSASPSSGWSRLFQPVVQLIHTREWIRNETMKLFWAFRQELQQQLPFEPWQLPPELLLAYFRGSKTAATLLEHEAPAQSGWDIDTFLCNRSGRRLPVRLLANVRAGEAQPQQGIGIYPGKVKGQVWRVVTADLESLQPPDFDTIILVADALDPGWVPYFSRVDGVLAYVGGLLSHASIMLRESAVPSATQIPASLELQTGDWIEMDGRSGQVVKL